VEPDLNDEQRLIARAQRGDLQAYETLVRQYEQIAFRTAYLITRDESDAADTAQDAFLRAYHALKSFQLGRPFRPWLLRIVTTQSLNRLQALQRRERMTERYTQQVLVSGDMRSPERVLAEHERGERLMQAVRQLSGDEQALISLRYFLELPEGEIAESLKIPRGTVKSRLHRTLAKLRNIIRREFPDLNELIPNET
jgi:RNA polymerase sigma-70 factor, ECF subfamily